MHPSYLYSFIKRHKHAVIATVDDNSHPEAALVGIAVTSKLEIIFDTESDTRKYENLLDNPHIAMVIGWEGEETIQFEGIASIHEPQSEDDELLQTYFEVFPDGRARRDSWDKLVYFHVIPNWIRYSDFGSGQVEEFNF
ncbi:MAG: hypothetical protein GC181_11425 [Bacteroidetes bacterium]|nr:hypothetical protein [Bacteroidota bacterium]